MPMIYSPRSTRSSSIKIKDKDSMKRLIKIYANSENIRDEAKAATLLIYEGYRAWVTGNRGRSIEYRLAKYYTRTSELLEALRVIVDGIQRIASSMDESIEARADLEKYARYGREILDQAIVEMGMEKEPLK